MPKAFLFNTTIRKDMRERLPAIRLGLSREVSAILEANKADSHIRGG